MDPNANLQEQEQTLQQLQAQQAAGRSERTLRATQRRLSELRQALYDWIRDGGFEPDWSLGPTAAEYYGRTEYAQLGADTDRIFAAFAWCPVCKTQHHPNNSSCDGLRGGTTDRLAAPPAPAPAAAGSSEPAALVKALQVLVLDPRTRAYLRQQDPRALQQAAKALHDVGERYQLFGEAPTATGDLCWYCFMPLVTRLGGRTVCPACRHDGRAVQPQPVPSPQYHVVVGNVGTVYSGSDEQDALSTFNVYVEQSKHRSGRAAGEPVTLFADEEPVREYQPPAAAGDQGDE